MITGMDMEFDFRHLTHQSLKRIHHEDEVMEDLHEDASFKILRHMLSFRGTLSKYTVCCLLSFNTQHSRILNNHFFDSNLDHFFLVFYNFGLDMFRAC